MKLDSLVKGFRLSPRDLAVRWELFFCSCSPSKWSCLSRLTCSFLDHSISRCRSSTWLSQKRSSWLSYRSSSKQMPRHPAAVQQPDTGTAVKHHVDGQESSPWPVARTPSPPVMRMTIPSRTITQYQVVTAGRRICVQLNNHGLSQKPKLTALLRRLSQVALKQHGVVLATS